MSAPSAPVITVLPVASPNTLQFYWEPPTQNGGFPLSSYTLLCSSIPFSTVFGPSVNYAVVSSLTNAQDYTFQINASNQIGSSPYRAFTIVQPGSVPGGVTNVGISTINLSTANIVWNFSTNTGEAQTKWFVITAIPSTTALSTIVQSAHGVERSRAIRNLSSYTYTFLVQAINDAGYAFPLAQAQSTFTFGQYINANGNFFPAAQVSSLMLWIDASDAGTLTLNSGNVSTIADKSGNNYNLIQGNTSFQPAYNSVLLNSLGGITYNATNNTQLAYTQTGSFTVAATDAGLFYSLDGINNWTACINATSSSTCGTPAYNGSMWVCSIGAYPHYSYDGITWSRSNQGYIAGNSNSNVYSVGWDSTKWVMGLVPGSQALLYSYDGVTWQNSAQGTALANGYAVMCVCWNGSLWTAGLRYHPTSQTMYSYDGINWQFSPTGNTFSNNYVNAMAWNGTMFVAGGAGSGYSYDGINWQPHSSSFFTNSIAWNGKIWILCGSNVYYSYDGITFTVATGATTLMSSFRTVTWSGSAWLIGGTRTAGGVSMISSTDGITWANVSSASSNITITTGLSIWGLASRATQPLPYKNVQANSTIGVTVLSVVQPTWAPGSGQTNNYFFNMTNASSNNQYGLSLTNTYTTGGEAVIASTTTFHNNPSTLAAFTQNAPVLISQSNNNVNDYLYINGNPEADIDLANPPAFPNNFSNLYLGGNGSNGSCFTGNIYETIVVAGVLQTQRRQQLEGYLAWKWALNTLLPSSHPYKLAAPTYTPATFDPTLLPGLTIWLDGNDTTGTGATVANGTALTTWFDKSGWGRNATMTGSPTIITNAGNGKSGVNFSATGANNMYGGITMPAQTYINELNMFIVYKSTGAAPTYTDLISRGQTATPVGGTGNTFSLYNGNMLSANGASAVYASTYNTNLSIWNGLVSQKSATTSFFRLTINGVEQAVVSGSPSYNFTPYDAAGFITIGSSRSTGTFTGHFCEMLIFNTPLSTNQRDQVEGYLAWKWGLQSSLQTSHPYYVATPTPNPVAFNPSQIDGCAFWLDATDPLANGSAPNTLTAVNTWFDKSGNNRNFSFNGSSGTYTTGLFGSLPGIDMTNGSGYSSAAFPNTINASLAMVVNFQPSFFTTGWANLFHHGDRNADFCLERDNAGGSGNNAIHLQTNGLNTTNDMAVYPGTMVIYGTMARGLTVYLSTYSKATGKQQMTYTTTLGWTYGSKIAYLGKSDAGEPFNSYMGEVAYYNRQLNASEEANLVNYLQNKWGTNPTFVPTQITNCAAWYDATDPLANGVQQASSFALSTWADKSGNSRNLTVGSSSNVNYTMNLFGANPGVQVNANLGLSTAAFQNSSNASIFMVVNVNGNIGTNGTFFVHGDKTNDFAVKRNGTTQTLELQTNNDNSSTVPYSTNTTTLLSGVMTSGTSRYFSVTTANGQQIATATNPLSWTSGVKILTVGSSISTAFSESSNSYIAEVVYYTSALTTWQRQVVEGYLAWKWGVATGLPSTHPWRLRAPTYQTFSWNPAASIPYLGLWLDGADSSTILYQGGNSSLANTSVRFWLDKGPNCVHYTQSTVNYQPQFLLDSTYNKFGMYYTGQLNANTFWQALNPYSSTLSPFSQSPSWTIITVHRVTSATATASGSVYRLVGDVPFLQWFRYWNSVNVASQAFTTSYSTAAQASGIHCHVGNGNNFNFFGNGTNAISVTKGTTVMTNTTNVVVGNYNSGGPSGEPFQGYIFEFLVFKHALPDTRRQLIEGFLAYKWGLQANLPATHPFATIQPTDYTIALPNTISGCTLWLDGQDLTTLWQNTAASTPVTAVGQSVNYWTDKSGANNHMTTSGLSVTAPQYTNLGINFGVTTNVSKMISVTTPAKSLNNTIFIVLTPVTTTNGASTVFSHQAASDRDANLFAVRGNAASTSFGIRSNSTQNAAVTTVVGNPTILYGTMTSGTTYAFQALTTSSATLSATGTGAAAITTAAGPIYIGSDDSTNWCNAMISEVIYYQAVLTPNQIWNNLEYLENKWGPGATMPNALMTTASTWLPLLTNSFDIGQTKQTTTQNGSVTFPTTAGRQSANFNNSTNTYISLPFTGSNTFTICYWFYATDNGYYNPWALSSSSTGAGSFGCNPDLNNGLQHFYLNFAGGIVNPGNFTYPTATLTWYHLALTVNKTTGVCTSYYNGIFNNSVTGSGILNHTQFLILGKAGDNGRAFNGNLRHFMVYNSILTQAQIQNVMLLTGAS
jgi:hypothetical protein